MIEFIRRSGIVIPRTYEIENFYWDIRNKLVRKFAQYNSPELFTTYKFFNESENYLTIPRFFPIQDYVNCKIIDKTHEGEVINIEHNITPRNSTQETTIDFMLKNDYGVIQLNPGMGKTVISIYTIATRKRKSLILVHRESLLDQWKNRFLQFTNLKQESISILTSGNFKKALNQPIILATVQTIISILKNKRIEFLIALNDANIGIFIGDEVHTTVGAPTFSGCSIHIPSKVTFGLSATPYRWDGNTDIITNHLGEVFAQEDDTDTMKPEIVVMLFDFGIDTHKRYRYLHWDGSFQRSRYLNLIRKSKPVLAISDALLKKFAPLNKNALFISERINFIEDMVKKWGGKKLYKSVSKFIAGSDLEELEKQLTFSTPGKIRDGVDAPWKDLLILTSPIKNIEQMIGRVTRSHPGKKTPKVIDMVDIGCSQIRNTLWGRLKFYKQKDWDIKFIVLNTITGIKLQVSEADVQHILQGGDIFLGEG